MINPFYTVQAFNEKNVKDISPGKNRLPALPTSPHKSKTIRPDPDISEWTCWNIHITTDKQFYKPKETVYVIGYITDHATHTITTLPESAVTQKRRAEIVKKVNNNDDTTTEEIVITSDSGFELKNKVSIKEGTFMYKWEIPENQSGGEYTIKCEKYPCKSRKINIQKYIQPHFILDIKFDREGYCENDLVSGIISTKENGTGDILVEACEINATIDNNVINGIEKIEQGKISFNLQLPKIIYQDNSISLTAKITYNNSIGTTSKTIPIVMNVLDVKVYVESSSYLISNVHNVVYFECFLKNGNPGYFEGEIIDKNNNIKIMPVKTYHEGRGKSIPFIPQSDIKYALHIIHPVCKNNIIDLPEVTEGALIHSTHSSYNSSAIDIEIERSDVKNKYFIGLYLKEIEIDYREVVFDKQLGIISFCIPPNQINLAGVFRVTLYTEDEIPIAERLVYINPIHSINIDIKGDKNYYKPGETVELTIHTYNEKILPIDCNVSVSVVDEGVLNLEEKRLQNPSLPLMIYVENEVDHLEDPTRYLSSDLKGNDEIDLLLATQGWRRFIYKNVYGIYDDCNEKDIDKYKRIIGRNKKIEVEEDMILQADNFPLYEEEALVMESCCCDDDDMGYGGLDPEACSPCLIESESKEVQAKEIEVEREFAFNPKDVKIRNDFRSTLFCSDCEKCKKMTRIRFQLGDSISSYRVRVEGFIINDSVYGSKDITIHSQLPFYLNCTPPIYVCDKDEIHLPVVVNLNPSLCKEKSIKLLLETSDGFKCDNCKYEWHQKKTSHKEVFIINANYLCGKSTPKNEELKLENENDNICESKIKLLAYSDDYNDSAAFPIKIYPKGYYYNITKNGILKETVNELKFDLPPFINTNTTQFTLTFQEPLLDKILSSVHSLIRKPYGCFEQTSSVLYPMILAMKYMKTKGRNDKKIEENGKIFIDEGYKKLITYQTEEGGFEWFGDSPACETLTAYGLMEFEEMKEIYTVDEEMENKAVDWLMSRIDERNGYFNLDSKQLDDFGRAGRTCSSAYIYWCLTNFITEGDIKTSFDVFYEKFKDTNDPYILSLLGLACLNLKQPDKRNEIIKVLLTMQKDDGFIYDPKDSITHSKNDALKIETTALCLLLWIKAKRNTTEINNAINKSILTIQQYCSDGFYGSTQGTILCLKVLIEYDNMMNQNTKFINKNEMEIELNNKSIMKIESEKMKENNYKITITKDSLNLLVENENSLNIKFKNELENPMKLVYSLKFYSKEKPTTANECNVNMDISISEKEMKEGDLLHMNLRVWNITDQCLGMVLSRIGIPGGCEVRYHLLRELRKEGKISCFELIDNYLILYWKDLTANEEKSVVIELECKIPGTFEIEHSELYEYYNDDSKFYIDNTFVNIK